MSAEPSSEPQVVCPNCGYGGAMGCASVSDVEYRVYLRCHRCGADYNLDGTLIELAPADYFRLGNYGQAT